MDTNANRVVGAELRTMRERAGLTQVEVARRLRKPQSHVSKLESGERSLHLYELFDYANALNVSATELVCRVEIRLEDYNKTPDDAEEAEKAEDEGRRG